jgi:hypothetical protein
MPRWVWIAVGVLAVLAIIILAVTHFDVHVH